MKEKQIIIPGIIEIRDLRNDKIHNINEWIGTWGGRHPDYESVYSYLIGRSDPTHTIHTIEVNGQKFSVGETVGVSGYGDAEILNIVYGGAALGWRIDTDKKVDCEIQHLLKLPVLLPSNEEIEMISFASYCTSKAGIAYAHHDFFTKCLKEWRVNHPQTETI